MCLFLFGQSKIYLSNKVHSRQKGSPTKETHKMNHLIAVSRLKFTQFRIKSYLKQSISFKNSTAINTTFVRITKVLKYGKRLNTKVQSISNCLFGGFTTKTIRLQGGFEFHYALPLDRIKSRGF